ncbi:hypothetical protein Peur_068848 [Populus x canadensis]
MFLELKLACLFKSTFRGGFAILEARKVFMSSSASAVRKKDGSVLDFYCTKSLHGGTLASDALCLIQMELQNEEHKTRVADYPCLSKLNSIPHVD